MVICESIAERKKYNQDIEQINSEMAQEDLAYRDATKEYNRQMQVSKETFANFKQDPAAASSNMEKYDLLNTGLLDNTIIPTTPASKTIITGSTKLFNLVIKFVCSS